jgi:hypothetical protein
LKLLIGFTCYIVLGAILSSADINLYNWKFYAVLGIVTVLEFNERYFTKLDTIKNCVKIVEGER